MGLCKCPKRKVTNQFCFEHRVNVCEHCMVTNHPNCVVQSYLQWLKDSDCNPICTVCNINLKNSDCVRLTCYHVFHWSCLDTYARSLPATTAPAGYTCPACNSCIFPEANLVSPVADVLKEKLCSVNWARAGLGLPLLSIDNEEKSISNNNNNEKINKKIEPLVYQSHGSTSSSIALSRTNSNINSVNSHLNSSSSSNLIQKQGPPYSVVNIEGGGSSLMTERKVYMEAYDNHRDDFDQRGFDHDENKYQRKSAIEWFLRWWKLITRPPARRRANPGTIYKRYALIGMVALLFFVFIIVLLSWLGRMATDNDPSFNLLANPNINIEKEAAI